MTQLLWQEALRDRPLLKRFEHPLPIQEQQPILRSTPRREEQQLQLIGGQQLLVVQAERELPVALGQMPRQLEHPLGAHTPSARQRAIGRVDVCPSLSEFVGRPDHAASRPSRRCRGKLITLPIPLSKAPPITPMERPSRRFAATSSSSSANSDTAS